MSSQLIFDLDNTLRTVLQQPTTDNLHRCFSLIKQCHFRRIEENIELDDSLYIPTILLLRQFPRFQHPSIFDQLLQEFLQLFSLMPVSSKKILDDFLGIISLILTKRIMSSNDEVQQDLFIRFFHQFCLAIQTNRKFFFQDFLGNFNQNLPILGHFLSCFLQLYEKLHTLDYRLHIIETLTGLFSLDKLENDEQSNEIIGQILACFLPGILKTFTQELHSLHHRLIQANLQLLTSVIRVTVRQAVKSSYPIKPELKDLLVERNQQWLGIVDQHLAGILQRLVKDYLQHENLDVRRDLGNFCLCILCYSSQWLTISSNLALKAIFVLTASKDQFNILKILLQKLFKCQSDTPPNSSAFLPFENEILRSPNLYLSDQLLIQCQTDLFQLFDQQSLIFKDRQWRLQLFLGYYTFIHQHIDFLFQMESFTEKFFRFICNSIDLQLIYRDNLNLFNQTSLPDVLELEQYDSIYKHMRSDVHEEIESIFRIFLPSNENFLDYVLEQIDRRKILSENNQKIFYLLGIFFGERTWENLDEYQRILALLDQLISEDKSNRKRKRRTEDPISTRNFTIYYLLQCLRRLTPPNQIEYHIDYIPLLLLCHSSVYTVIHQTSFVCLMSLTSNLPFYLTTQAEYIVDTSLRKIQTSTFDGYLILIEFVRLGRNQVINLPLMTHVIEQVLLELSCLPSTESIQLIFEFLNLFCQQVADISEKPNKNKKLVDCFERKSLIEFTLDLQKQYHQSNEETETSEKKPEEGKHPWHEMLVSIVDVFQHFISHSNVQIRSYVLDAFPSLAHLLSTIDENLFLPLVHKIWPGLVHRLHDKDINIRIRCLKTVQCLCDLCSDFVDRRIRQDIFPIIFQQLESNRLISTINALEYRYMKYLLTNIGSILNSLTLQFDEIEKLILILFQYLQIDSLASIAYEQLLILNKKYADHIWLKFILHDENEYRRGFFSQMKVYRPEPMFNIDSKWKRDLIDC